MNQFDSDVWLAQIERRESARRRAQLKRLVLIVITDFILGGGIVLGAMKWAGMI